MKHNRETDFVRGIYTTASTQEGLGQNFELLNKRALCYSSMHQWQHSARLLSNSKFLSSYDGSKDQFYRYHSIVQYDGGVFWIQESNV